MEKTWDKFIIPEERFPKEQYPKVSVIIPTINCAQNISETLESVLDQEYPSLEVVIIDASSLDRTLEVVKSYRDSRIRIYSVAVYQRYEMLNKGITLAQGEYVNFLFPGDFYISRYSLKDIMTLALDYEKPHLVYCGSLLRDGRSEVKMLHRELNIDLLKRGQQPTSLQSCWFRKDVFTYIGKFSIKYTLRGGFDLMCRFCLKPQMRFASTTRVLTDYDLRWVTSKMVLIHFKETMQIIRKYFGFGAVVSWLKHQRDIRRFIKLWFQKIGFAFKGR